MGAQQLLALVYVVMCLLTHVRDTITIAEVEYFLWLKELVGMVVLAMAVVSFLMSAWLALAAKPNSFSFRVLWSILPFAVCLIGGAGIMINATNGVLFLARFFGSRSLAPVAIATAGVKLFLAPMRSFFRAHANLVAIVSFVISSTVSLSIRRIALSAFGDDILGSLHPTPYTPIPKPYILCRCVYV